MTSRTPSIRATSAAGGASALATRQGAATFGREFGKQFINTAKTELIEQFTFKGFMKAPMFCKVLRGLGIGGAYYEQYGIWSSDKDTLDKLKESSVSLILSVFAAKGASLVCFPAGTKVHTQNGLANIEDLFEGDLVLTYNELTKEQEFKAILKKHERFTLQMLSIELPTGEFVRVTPEHRFFCNDEWLEARDLQPGDLLHLKGGHYTTVISVETLPHYEKVYNFDIEANENYYVTEDGILVHNGYASAAELKKIEDRGFTGVQATPNGGLNYANSDALYPVKEGQRNIIEINYSGDYTTDFQAASLAALGQKSTPKGYVWHHLDDYNPATNTGTMQLVKQEAHNGVSHTGGCSQYKAATGNSYTFKTW
jgi:hypothetical protein